MRIAIASDLHLEFGGVALTNTGAADVLVLAGDICVARQLPLAWFFDVCERFPSVIYVPGNHEYYGSDIDLMLDKMRFDLSCFPNLHVLSNETVEIDGVIFAGSTLWTSMNHRDPLTMWKVRRGMSDFNQIAMGTHPTFIHNHPPRLSPERWCDEHLKAVDFLLNANANIIITHFSPTFQSCAPQYKGSGINDGFHSSLDWLIEELAPSMWIHGHTHDAFDYSIGKTRMICNPRGYHGIENTSKWSLKYV
jgi:Icc-related predicted phosphoesterase